MRWNLRMKAAERGIWKSTELRRRLAEAGLEISAGKMSALWTGTPTTIRLDDLDVICVVLDCSPAELLIGRAGQGHRPSAVHGGDRQQPRRGGRRHGQRPAGRATAGPQPLPTAGVSPRNRQPPCSVCATALVAMRGVDYCFACWPGGPVTPPPCLRCGARTGYYTSGICVRCHPGTRPGVDSCLDCYAWGATRHRKWLCCGCLSWRATHARIDACRCCGRTLTVNPQRVCRLCRKQATRMRGGRGRLDLLGANRHGQQLFFADMFRPHPTTRPSPSQPATPPSLRPVAGHQLVLFAARRDLAAHGRAGLPQPPDPILAADLTRRARDLAARRGWSKRQTNNTCHGLRIVLGIQ